MRILNPIVLALLISLPAAGQNPQVPVQGTLGSNGSFPLVNSPSIVFSSDANHTMVYPEFSGSSGFLRVTSSTSLTAVRNLIVPIIKGFIWTVENVTTGGQSIVVIGTTGTGITITNGSTVTVASDGTNIVQSGPNSEPGFITSLTTIGSSGAATVTSGVLNIPEYSGGGGTVTYFSAPSGSWPSWLVPTVTNSTTTPSLAVVAGAIPNSALANDSMTIDGVSVPLGGSISTPIFCAGFSCPNINQNNTSFTTTATLTLTSNITSTSLTLPVVSTAGYPSVGCITIAVPTEIACYDSITSTSLIINSLSERGLLGTTAASHGTTLGVIKGIVYSQSTSPTSTFSQIILNTQQSGYAGQIGAANLSAVTLPNFTTIVGQVDVDGIAYMHEQTVFEGDTGYNYDSLNLDILVSGFGMNIHHIPNASTPTSDLFDWDIYNPSAVFVAHAIQINGNAFVNFPIGIGSAVYDTTTVCASAASPAVCGSAAAGSVLIPTGTSSSTLTVNTTAVTANSQILFYPDDTLGTRLSTTCNSTLATLAGGSFISARTPGTSFTITFNGSILTNGVCGSYTITN